jgi:hypothetical protein
MELIQEYYKMEIIIYPCNIGLMKVDNTYKIIAVKKCLTQYGYKYVLVDEHNKYYWSIPATDNFIDRFKFTSFNITPILDYNIDYQQVSEFNDHVIINE